MDGLTKEDVQYNIYAFHAEAKRCMRKAERARTATWRAHWTAKANEHLYYCQKNEQRLVIMEEETRA